MSVPLRVVPSSTLSSNRCLGIAFLSRADREITVFRHVAPPSRLRLEFPHETASSEVRGEGREPLADKASCGEGNGTPLQYSCLENPMGGAHPQTGEHPPTAHPPTVHTRKQVNTCPLHTRPLYTPANCAPPQDPSPLRGTLGSSRRSPAEGVSLPLGLALGSPIFPSGCEGKLGVALESLQGLRDLT